jgi:hypothetical protein
MVVVVQGVRKRGVLFLSAISPRPRLGRVFLRPAQTGAYSNKEKGTDRRRFTAKTVCRPELSPDA